MPQKILLITPPFTQLNTPYPATAYLKGYLDKKGYNCVQADLSIELFLKVFSKEFLEKVFIYILKSITPKRITSALSKLLLLFYSNLILLKLIKY
jgi:hypothetical protein